MSWRMKKTPYWGISKGGVLRLDEQPVEGCQHYEERKKLFLKGDEMPASERKALEQKVLDSQSQRNAPVALTLTLRHGDIMVMHGADIQKYYEVSGRRTSVHCFWSTLAVVHRDGLTFWTARCAATWQTALRPHLPIHRSSWHPGGSALESGLRSYSFSAVQRRPWHLGGLVREFMDIALLDDELWTIGTVFRRSVETLASRSSSWRVTDVALLGDELWTSCHSCCLSCCFAV